MYICIDSIYNIIYILAYLDCHLRLFKLYCEFYIINNSLYY